MIAQTTVNIPVEFLNLARSMGMPKETASNFYLRKAGGRSDVKDLVHTLALNHYPNEAGAKKALNHLWVEFQKLNLDAPHIPVAVSARVQPVERQTKQTYLEQARGGLERLLGQINTPAYSGNKPEADRIVVGGDLHGLFYDPQAFKAFAEDRAQTAILMGDFMDLYAASKYSKTISHITMREELADARAKAEYLATKFKTIYYVAGNHDVRAQKRVADMFPQLLPLLIDPLELIFSGLPQFKRLTTVIPNTQPNTKFGTNVELDYCGMVGDILVGHFNNFCGIDAPRQIEGWLGAWGHVLKLETQPRIILQGHSHAMSMSCTPRGRRLISTGCLCKSMEYQFEGHGKYNPATVGYLALYQSRGRTDTSRIEFHTFDPV